MTNTLNTPGSAGQRASADVEALLPRPPGVIRRWFAAHPNAVDWIIVGAYLLGCGLTVVANLILNSMLPNLIDSDSVLTEELDRRARYLQWPWLLIVIGSVTIVAIALRLRRKYPLIGVPIVGLLLFFDQGLLIFPHSVAVYFLLYAVPVYRGTRAGWVGYAIAAVSSTVQLQLTGGENGGPFTPAGIMIAPGPYTASDHLTMSILNAVWLLVIVLVGINLGNRRRYVDALIDRAHQLAREREQQGQLSAAAERARIAREMHDVVAHSLSVVVTLSEAASVAVESKPVAAQHAMQRAAETGRSALVEMRRLLGVLADGGDSDVAGDTLGRETAKSFAPQPGIAQLADLVAGFAEAGLRISFAESGSALGDSAQQLASYRIIQEGLTNTLRHSGPGTQVDLLLSYAADATEITLVDSGPRAAADTVDGARPKPLSAMGSGRGLVGMKQRAQLFGGSVEHGPFQGGWRLFARIPINPTSSAQKMGSKT